MQTRLLPDTFTDPICSSCRSNPWREDLRQDLELGPHATSCRHVVVWGCCHRLESLGGPLLANLPSLQELLLPRNALCGTLGREVGALRVLRVLDVRENRLTALPAELAGCTSLVELHAGAVPQMCNSGVSWLEPGGSIPSGHRGCWTTVENPGASCVGHCI